MENSNYVQVIPMTDDELRECYSKLTKKELIEMLIQNNKVIEILLKTEKQDNYKKIEQIPTYQSFIKCKSWADCTNPHFDCVNCPLRYNTNADNFINRTN